MIETFHFAAGHRDSKEGLKKGHTITSLQSAGKVDCRSAETLSCHPLLLYLPLTVMLRATYSNPCPLCASRPSSAQDGSFMHSESSFPSLSVINKHVATFFMSEKTDTTSDLEQKAGKFPRRFGTSVLWVGSTLLHTQHLPSFPIPITTAALHSSGCCLYQWKICLVTYQILPTAHVGGITSLQLIV